MLRILRLPFNALGLRSTSSETSTRRAAPDKFDVARAYGKPRRELPFGSEMMPAFPMPVRFGVEIEHQGLNFERVADIVAAALTGARLPTDPPSVRDPHGRLWTMHYDGGGIELVTPILRGNEDLRDLLRIVADMRDAGARADSQAGLHVHIDGEAFSPRQVLALMCLMSRHENWLYPVWGVDAARSAHCAPIEPSVAFEMAQKRPKDRAAIGSIWGTDRYIGLNLQNYIEPTKKNTIEFRYRNGRDGIDPTSLGCAIGFYMALATHCLAPPATEPDALPATRPSLSTFVHDVEVPAAVADNLHVLLAERLEEGLSALEWDLGVDVREQVKDEAWVHDLTSLLRVDSLARDVAILGVVLRRLSPSERRALVDRAHELVQMSGGQEAVTRAVMQAAHDVAGSGRLTKVRSLLESYTSADRFAEGVEALGLILENLAKLEPLHIAPLPVDVRLAALRLSINHPEPAKSGRYIERLRNFGRFDFESACRVLLVDDERAETFFTSLAAFGATDKIAGFCRLFSRVPDRVAAACRIFPQIVTELWRDDERLNLLEIIVAADRPDLAKLSLCSNDDLPEKSVHGQIQWLQLMLAHGQPDTKALRGAVTRLGLKWDTFYVQACRSILDAGVDERWIATVAQHVPADASDPAKLSFLALLLRFAQVDFTEVRHTTSLLQLRSARHVVEATELVLAAGAHGPGACRWVQRALPKGEDYYKLALLTRVVAHPHADFAAVHRRLADLHLSSDHYYVEFCDTLLRAGDAGLKVCEQVAGCLPSASDHHAHELAKHLLNHPHADATAVKTAMTQLELTSNHEYVEASKVLLEDVGAGAVACQAIKATQRTASDSSKVDLLRTLTEARGWDYLQVAAKLSAWPLTAGFDFVEAVKALAREPSEAESLVSTLAVLNLGSSSSGIMESIRMATSLPAARRTQILTALAELGLSSNDPSYRLREAATLLTERGPDGDKLCRVARVLTPNGSDDERVALLTRLVTSSNDELATDERIAEALRSGQGMAD